MGYKGFYVACHKDKDVLRRSSSGGMFSVFANYVLRKDGVILGATYDKTEKKIRHIGITKPEDLDRVRKSKYVFSDFKESIDIINKAIVEDKYILFSGTPCQAAAIKSKYGDHDKLYIVDLFCHGTLEPAYFKEYLDSFDSDIQDVRFREQENDSKDNFLFCIYDNNGLAISDVYVNNPLTYVFLTSEGIRNVCFSCEYACREHISDITIGDWSFDYPVEWNKLSEFFHPSIVSVNNKKGCELFEACRDSFYSCKIGNKREEIDWYYRAHDTMKGLWGFDREKKREFDELREEKGFLYAAEHSMYENERALIEKAIERGNRKLCLYGSGNNGKRICRAISRFYRDRVDLQYFIVTDKKEDMGQVDGIRVFGLEEICDDLFDKTVVITIGNEIVIKEIEEILIRKGITDYVRW